MRTWNEWTDQIFQNLGFNAGNPARRKKSSVMRYGGGMNALNALKAACAYYRCVLIENGNQYLILPDNDLKVVFKN